MPTYLLLGGWHGEFQDAPLLAHASLLPLLVTTMKNKKEVITKAIISLMKLVFSWENVSLFPRRTQWSCQLQHFVWVGHSQHGPHPTLPLRNTFVLHQSSKILSNTSCNCNTTPYLTTLVYDMIPHDQNIPCPYTVLTYHSLFSIIIMHYTWSQYHTTTYCTKLLFCANWPSIQG